MELEKFSVRELTTEEQLQINGGGKLADFFAAVWDGIVTAAEWLWENLDFTLKIEVAKGVNLEIKCAD
jgi:hypothetical protein